MKSKSIAGYLCCVVMRRFERRSDHAVSREKDAKERASVRKFMICTAERVWGSFKGKWLDGVESMITSDLLPETDRERVFEASYHVDADGSNFLCLPFRYLIEPS